MNGEIEDDGRRRGLQFFALVLAVVASLLAVITIAAAPLLALFLTGRGPIRVSAHIKPPYSIGLTRDREMVVASEWHVTERVNFETGEEARYFKEPPRVHAAVRIDSEDTDTRAVLSASLAVLIGMAWLGWWELRAIVRSALRGDPFVPANAARLRWLAACVLSLPVVTWSTGRVVQRTLDVDPAVMVASHGPKLWAVLVVGFGLLALAEVFREGSVLRQLERETV